VPRKESSLAKVLVQTMGGAVKTMDAENPAGLAEQLGVTLDNTVITIGGEPAKAEDQLRDDDFVAFVTNKVTSGNEITTSE